MSDVVHPFGVRHLGGEDFTLQKIPPPGDVTPREPTMFDAREGQPDPLHDGRKGRSEPPKRIRLSCQTIDLSLNSRPSVGREASPPSLRDSYLICRSVSDETFPIRCSCCATISVHQSGSRRTAKRQFSRCASTGRTENSKPSLRIRPVITGANAGTFHIWF